MERLLFRAEWAEEPITDKPHPQPHWHFHPYSKRNEIEEESQENFEDIINGGFLKSLEAEETEAKIDIADMHLTMDYKIASDPYCEVWDESRIKGWADKTIDSIFDELDFVINKGHKL